MSLLYRQGEELDEPPVSEVNDDNQRRHRRSLELLMRILAVHRTSFKQRFSPRGSEEMHLIGSTVFCSKARAFFVLFINELAVKSMILDKPYFR